MSGVLERSWQVPEGLLAVCKNSVDSVLIFGPSEGRRAGQGVGGRTREDKDARPSIKNANGGPISIYVSKYMSVYTTIQVCKHISL